MKRKGRILLVLSCALLGILGCRKDRASQETSTKAVVPEELKIQEALKRMSDWRFDHWDDARRKRTLSTFRDELRPTSVQTVSAIPLIPLLQALERNNGFRSAKCQIGWHFWQTEAMIWILIGILFFDVSRGSRRS